MRLRHVLGGMALSLFSLLGASQAFAQADPCAGPFPGPNVSIVKSGDCTISSEINVSGTVSIQITGGSLTDASNIAGGSVSISQSGGTTTLAGLASSGPLNVSSDGALSIGSVSSQSSLTASSANSDINVGSAIFVEGGVQLTANNGKITTQAITANFQAVTLSSSGTLTTGAVSAPTGDLTETSANGDIDVTGAVNVQGAVKLTAANGKIDAQAAITSGGNLISLNADSIQGTSLTAGAYIYAKTTTGSINFSGDITSNTTGVGFGIQLYAQGDLATGNLSEAGTNGGFVDIWSNMGGASSPFTIGGTGNTNGINGTITATGASSNRNGLLVQNGTASSTGDITITNGSNINVTNTGAQSGSIWISANQGTITIQGGTLSVNGSGTQAGGGIVLIGNTISAPSGAVLSAMQSTSVSGINSQIWLAATNINFGGSGLTADADGSYGQIFAYPAGTLSVTTNMSTSFLIWNLSPNYAVTGNVAFNGAGSPLTLTANGTNGTLFVETPQGNITFDAGPISLTANGTNGDLYVNPGIGGVTFNSAENPITLTANGTNGQVDVWSNTANITFNGSNNPLTLSANGDNGQINVGSTSGNIDFNNPGGAISLSANGNNTRVNVNGYPLTFTGSSLSVTANGNSSNFIGLGVGNNTQTGSDGINFDITGATVIDASAATGQSSGNINIWEDQVTINGTSFAMMVNGPSSGDGNAGALSLLWANTILNPATAASFSANGPSSGNGNGGSITYWPGAPTIAFGSSAGQLSFAAKGGGVTGNGGSISISGSDMSFNGTQAGSMDVSVPGTTGDGGSISVGGGSITFSGTGYLLAANGGTTQGNGGTISINPFAAVTVGNSAGGVILNAKGVGNGNGGSVTIGGLPLTVDGASIDVSAGSASGSNGNGGSINLTSNFTFGNPWLSGNLTANGNGTGRGGTISVATDSAITVDETTQLIAQSSGTGSGGTVNINSQGAVTVNSGSIQVEPSSGSNGNGGNVSIVSTGTGSNGLITFNADVDASGDGTGSGGTITVNGDSLQFADAQLIANGGDTGNGGAINITTTDSSAASFTSSGVISATGGSSAGNGGSFTLSTASDVTLDPSAFTLSAGSAGNGGNVSITSGGNVTITGDLNAAGGCGDGNGGAVSITGNILSIENGDVSAGAETCMAVARSQNRAISPNVAPNGTGGTYTLTGTQFKTVYNGQLRSNGQGTGMGGTITINLSQGEPTITGATLTADGGPAGPGGTITINGTGTGPISIDSTTSLSASAGASAATGNGGTITFKVGDALAVNGPSIKVASTGNGLGGTVSLASTGTGQQGIITTSGALSVNGAGSGNGGQLTVIGDTLAIDGSTITANGGATGSGGSVSLTSTSQTADESIGVTATSISVRGGTTSGNGNNLTITANGLLALQSNLALDTSAVGTTGNGGNIQVTTPGQLSLNGGPITSDGAEDTGSGGTILLSAGTTLLIPPGGSPLISADGSGTGAGGSITLHTNPTTPINVYQVLGPNSISAIGGDNGSGGVVSINAVGFFEVNSIIQVSAGSSVTDTTTFDGSISLNGVTCQQWLTGYSTWPHSFWDCMGSETPSAADLTIASQAQALSGLVSTYVDLQTINIGLYSFSGEPSLQLFFNDAVATGNTASGATFAGLSLNYTYVSVFPPLNTTTVRLNETTTHEIGHAIDWSSNPRSPSQSNSQGQLANTTYGQYIQNDFFYLDYMAWPGSDNVNNRRPACIDTVVNNVTVKAPLSGLNDKTQPFCGVGVGYDPVSHLENQYVTNGVPWRTSKIVQQFSYRFNQFAANYFYPGGWAETYAPIFAYEAYVVPQGINISATGAAMFYGLLQNGYFTCSAAWGAALASGSAQPPASTPLPSPMPGTCTTPVQDWYPAVLGQ